MIGPLLLALSWLLLRLEGRGLAALGFDAPRRRATEFVVGFGLAGTFALGQHVLTARFSGFDWVVNPDLTGRLVLEGLRWNVNSVLFEELVFRGYLLVKAIEWWGVRRACLAGAAVFGVYHWFSFGVFGDAIPMVYVFLMTGTFGGMLAYAFARTRSVFLPIALHLGWNVVTILVFSNGPIGTQLFVPDRSDLATSSGGEQAVVTIAVPLVLAVSVVWWLATHVRPPSRPHAG